GSGALSSEGAIMFGGTGGLTVIQPNKVSFWTYIPPIVVTDIKVGGTSLPVNRFNRARANEVLTVPPGESMSVEFSALDYSAPERNLYSYRLEGFDKTWTQADAMHRAATYTNLSPGSYTLHVRGSNRNGTWSDRELQIAVRVLPAWYETIWIKLAAVILGLAAIFALVQSRTLFLRKRQQELEALIDQRTSDLIKSQLQLEKMAYFDVLTELPNRRMFSDDFRKLLALARREKRGFALLLIDLDRFKHINDTLGHDAGDALLIETAALLRSVLRDSDCVARLGGDEFAILLVEAHDEASIDIVCERIVTSFITPVKFKTEEIKTSPSIGVAMFPEDGDNQESLYKSADLALYAAKQAGRNTWRR
ncbi:GGDEF domain-containing protein, partial [Asticcacaulis benevestitus]